MYFEGLAQFRYPGACRLKDEYPETYMLRQIQGHYWSVWLSSANNKH